MQDARTMESSLCCSSLLAKGRCDTSGTRPSRLVQGPSTQPPSRLLLHRHPLHEGGDSQQPANKACWLVAADSSHSGLRAEL